MDEEEIYSQFRLVFEKHYPELCKYAFSIIKDKEACEDLVQEIFMKVWEKKRELVVSNSIRFYLFTAIRNNSYNYLKVKQRTSIISMEQNDHLLSEKELQEDVPPVDYRLMLEKGIDQLPPKCKEVFLLSRFGKLSYQEIADSLEISVKTVENQIGKALKILRSVVKVVKLLFIILFLSR